MVRLITIETSTAIDSARVRKLLLDVAAWIEAGEWTDNPKTQVKGAAKQAEGKVQNAWGKAQDAAKQTADDTTSKPPKRTPEDADSDEREIRRRG